MLSLTSRGVATLPLPQNTQPARHESYASEPSERPIRRLMAKFEKIIVDVQAANPSSWKTTCMAVRMISQF